ncbi:MAG: hypothetical protein ACOC56_01110 [Atribacterota bacterium]
MIVDVEVIFYDCIGDIIDEKYFTIYYNGHINYLKKEMHKTFARKRKKEEIGFRLRLLPRFDNITFN